VQNITLGDNAPQYHLDESALERWIVAQPIRFQPILRKLGRNIRHVSGREFGAELGQIFERFIQSLDPNKKYILFDLRLSAKTKSNGWITENFLRYIGTKHPNLSNLFAVDQQGK
jgi:hypothetical protein